jgi:zinc protease
VADPDRPVLDVLERLLGGGDSARLQRDLVREHEVATAVAANNSWGIQQDLFWIYAQARPKKTAADLERRIDAVVGALVERPVPEDELAKAKNQLKAELVRSLKTVSGKANQLGYLDVIFGDYRALFGLDAAWDAVTAADVLRVARAHLVPARRTIVELRPVPAEGPPLGDAPPKGGGAAT